MAGFLSPVLAALGLQQQPQSQTTTPQMALGLSNQQTLELPQVYQPQSPGMQGIPTAAQEALQPSNLTGEFIRRIYGPNFERTYGPHYGKIATEAAANLIPMVMGVAGMGKAGGVGELEESAGALEGLLGERAAPTTPLERGAPTATFQKQGLPYWHWSETQPGVPYQYTGAPKTGDLPPARYTLSAETAHTQTLGHHWADDPFTPTPTGELQMPQGQTGPLRGLAQQPERYHGTPMDIVQVTHPSISSDWEGNLYGAGLYTTNDFATAEGYAGQYGDKGQIYRIHEIQPVKFFDIDKQRFPDSVWESLGNPRMAEIFGAGGRRTELEEPVPLKNQHIESQFAWLKRNNKLKDVVEMLKREGYGGFKHTGGARSGNIAHEVKIYWDPERQVAMRRSPFHFGAEAAEEPTVNYPGYFPPKE